MQINVYIVQKHNYAENKYIGEKFFLLMTKKKNMLIHALKDILLHLQPLVNSNCNFLFIVAIYIFTITANTTLTLLLSLSSLIAPFWFL